MMLITITDPLCSPYTATVTIDVVDDLAPKFDFDEYNASVEEGSPVGFFVVQVHATSENVGTSDILYSIKSGTNGGLDLFEIVTITGEITVKSDQIDYESFKEHVLVVEAQERGTDPPRSASATVIITIIDVNDLCPYFESPSYAGSIAPEDSFVLDTSGTERLRLIAVDGDITGFIGVVRIESDTSNGGFLLEPTSTAGQWYIVVDDPSDLGVYTVVVSVIDDRGDQSCAEDRIDVTINVTDAFNPKFDLDLYEVDVPENAPADYPVVQVSAQNKDGDSQGIVYHIQTSTSQGLSNFQIDPRTGQITVKAGAVIDAELVDEFVLIVEATDTRLDPQRSASATVVITIIDVNDLCPFFESPSYSGLLAPEDSFVLDASGIERLRLIAVDGDISGFIGIVRIESDTSGGGFALEPTSTAGQWYIVVDNPALVDLGDYTVVVSVIDDRGDQSCAENRTSITITVTNALNPKFDLDLYEADVPENAPVDYPVVQVFAQNKDGNSQGIVYRIQTSTSQGVSYFQIDPRTGQITVKAGAVIDAELVDEFILIVEATDTRLDPQRYGN
ncbi:cadherin EGF LAG seven-pass G-type receptor 2-like [Amphiura filiformis]|uniref:cadherin EGF LAG seven-pass G-type receptor 2-like n=1 Tax=Amphiura filiformis TaxID=82378 RepID=UPI003B21F39C